MEQNVARFYGEQRFYNHPGQHLGLSAFKRIWNFRHEIEAVAAAVIDLPIEEARQYIFHNTTHNAYVNLIEGNADIIFVTPPSEEELAYAEKLGVELEVIPMLRDGFVFFVNENNPVNNVAFQDIVDIYSGTITNWKQLGGEDKEIIAYQREENSGSQTGMLKRVMKDTPMMEAPKEFAGGYREPLQISLDFEEIEYENLAVFDSR